MVGLKVVGVLLGDFDGIHKCFWVLDTLWWPLISMVPRDMVIYLPNPSLVIGEIIHILVTYLPSFNDRLDEWFGVCFR
jgi:hypothetical protein